MDEERLKEVLSAGDEIIKRKEEIMTLKDIRLRDWQKLDTRVSKILNLLIEAEDILGEIDDYQMDNDQCYPDIEDIYNQVANIRGEYTIYIDNNLELLEIDESINEFQK